jgi:hypothetical protein
LKGIVEGGAKLKSSIDEVIQGEVTKRRIDMK